MKTIIKVIVLIVSFIGLLFINSCSVGALVKVKAQNVDYPVSHTDSYYSINDSLIQTGQYAVQKEFSFSFTKWGVQTLIDIERDEDISKELNNLIEKNGGNAIVDLTISVSNPSINGLTLFVKTISFWMAIVGTSLTISDPSSENAIIAATSIAVYLFTPAAAKISIEGKVVKKLND